MVKITLFLSFLKIGFFSFGGGLSMLPLMFQELQAKGWMTASEFADLVAISQVTPGPVAVNAATYVGNDVSGLLGAAFATVGVTMSSFIVMMVVMRGMDKYREKNWVQAIFKGIRPATVGLLGSALFFMFKGVEDQVINAHLIYQSIGFFLIVLLLSGKFKLNPITITVLSGIVGAGIYGFLYA